MDAKRIEVDVRSYIPELNNTTYNGNSLEQLVAPSDLTSMKIEEPLRKHEIVVIVRRVTMGMGSRNPIERVRVNDYITANIISKNIRLYSLIPEMLSNTYYHK